MAKHTKLREKLFANPAPRNFTWDELVYLLEHYGYEIHNNNGGSSRKFVNKGAGHIISLHKPHPGNELKAYVVKRAKEAILEIEEGLL